MEQKIRVVLAGCGGISQAWLSAIKDIPELQIVGLVDLNREAALLRAEQYRLYDAQIHTDLEAALAEIGPDVVFDCTTPEAHVQVTLEALAHGCHVLGEKPLADTMDNARIMIAAAQQAGRIFAVIQNRRYDPNIRRLERFLRSGAIGPITTVDCDFYIGAHFGGFRDHMKHVLLLDMAIHTFDAARLITGADPLSVYCKEWNPPGSWYDHDASAVAIFDMSDEIVYTYRGSWCAEGLNTTWEGNWRIVGEQGSVTWDGVDGFQAQVVAETGGFRSKWRDVELPPYEDTEKVGSHGGVIRDFVRAVKTGGIPETVCTDNVKSLAMSLAAVESAERGQRVDIEW